MRWGLVSGEYPPAVGGVADYTHLLAQALVAAGDQVHVWAPGNAATTGGVIQRHPLRGWRPDWSQAPQPLQILVQYVPHAYGWKGMNLPFSHWLYRQRGLRPWVMFHEVAFPLAPGQSVRHRLLAHANRRMAAWARFAAARSFVAIPAWNDLLAEIAPAAAPSQWLPIFSNLPERVDAERVAATRQACFPYHRGDGPIVGHFGRFQAFERATIARAVRVLLAAPDPPRVLFIGPGGEKLARQFSPRQVHATGYLPPPEAALHLAATDVLLQPYPDGVSSRRGTAIAAIALGCALITCDGHLTDPVWRQTQAALVLPHAPPAQLGDALAASAAALLADLQRRQRMSAGARAWYQERFAIAHTVAALRAAAIH